MGQGALSALKGLGGWRHPHLASCLRMAAGFWARRPHQRPDLRMAALPWPSERASAAARRIFEVGRRGSAALPLQRKAWFIYLIPLAARFCPKTQLFVQRKERDR